MSKLLKEIFLNEIDAQDDNQAWRDMLDGIAEVIEKYPQFAQFSPYEFERINDGVPYITKFLNAVANGKF